MFIKTYLLEVIVAHMHVELVAVCHDGLNIPEQHLLNICEGSKGPSVTTREKKQKKKHVKCQKQNMNKRMLQGYKTFEITCWCL